MSIPWIHRHLLFVAVGCLAISPLAWGHRVMPEAAPELAPAAAQEDFQANLVCNTSDATVLKNITAISGLISYKVDLLYSASCQQKFSRISQFGQGTWNYEVKLQYQDFFGNWIDYSSSHRAMYFTSYLYSGGVGSNGPAGALMRACGRPLDTVSLWTCTNKG